MVLFFVSALIVNYGLFHISIKMLVTISSLFYLVLKHISQHRSSPMSLIIPLQSLIYRMRLTPPFSQIARGVMNIWSCMSVPQQHSKPRKTLLLLLRWHLVAAHWSNRRSFAELHSWFYNDKMVTIIILRNSKLTLVFRHSRLMCFVVMRIQIKCDDNDPLGARFLSNQRGTLWLTLELSNRSSFSGDVRGGGGGGDLTTAIP